MSPTGSPHRGKRQCTTAPDTRRNVASYTAVQAAALLFVALTVVPLRFTGAVAALAVSAGTHLVIDRRWLVSRIIRAKAAYEWQEGP